MVIGYAYVVGDILHKGHISYLQNCKALCDKLICGVLTDKAIMEKKPKPILSLDERMALVKPYADAVVMQDGYSPLKNAVGIGADYLFESQSHSKDFLEMLKKSIKRIKDCPIKRILIMPYYLMQSSTNIKEIIRHGN